MTDHGFIRVGVGSNIDDKTLHEIAHKVSNLPDVIWLHHVKHVEGEELSCEFIVEFDPRPTRTYEHLLREIEKINKQVGRKVIHEPIDVWIIQCSYKGPR